MMIMVSSIFGIHGQLLFDYIIHEGNCKCEYETKNSAVAYIVQTIHVSSIIISIYKCRLLKW
jgi:hypothetical protein